MRFFSHLMENPSDKLAATWGAVIVGIMNIDFSYISGWVSMLFNFTFSWDKLASFAFSMVVMGSGAVVGVWCKRWAGSFADKYFPKKSKTKEDDTSSDI